MQMFLEGRWMSGGKMQPVINPYDGKPFDEVPVGTAAEVDRALAALVRGAAAMKALSAWERSKILERAAELMTAQADDFARTITLEEGKPIRESRLETSRAIEVLRLSAEEARRLCGEMVPLDGTESGQGKIGFTLRVPCGIVAAITPFNFPLNLTTHKVGPALAGGNAVLIKPASNTPLSALKLTRVLLDAGLPPESIACVTGPGGALGKAICEDRRLRKISFTGSYEVGEMICRAAGVKKVTMELGGNAPIVVMDDADLDKAATAVASAGYANAGQVCISAQRIVTDRRVQSDFVDALTMRVKGLKSGDPLDESTTIGPLVREGDAERVANWIEEAAGEGASVVTGGKRSRAFLEPAILNNVTSAMKVGREELFGPAVAVMPAANLDDAIRMANDTRYGLSAGIFTQDIDRAMRFAKEVESGCVHINWSSQWRADLMPYGGLKDSGFGKEGPSSAIREMTEEKMIVLHLPAAQAPG
ncbi:Succinate-semialdehyde dehydrogenase [NADP(+)] GabD [Caulifigura coniformis]|uniref:Salicylaldehyde dehydrogenase n=1 Tax=Caulifigura coniformis TaxID=2527983 RepID=A0A517SEL2_9PLAN|nr:aldehyde dehydrogenase family protein [Caulifigura coniformis]QDT54564.1 Succinate-semialdehyde dehydrogenase [NADP(+)] GabD [Caulifigura coniformis]